MDKLQGFEQDNYATYLKGVDEALAYLAEKREWQLLQLIASLYEQLEQHEQ